MARVIENEELYETWRNETQGMIVLKRVARTGELVDEILTAGKVIHLTPAERRMNQELFAEESYDFFKNGTLSPVRLIETEEDAAQLRSNPNHVSEDEMRSLFKSRSLKAFQERVDQITNPVALNKLLKLAEAEDATIKQVDTIKGRLEKVSPSLFSEVRTVGGPR